jgi:iron(III) transport system substrate-binding protein
MGARRRPTWLPALALGAVLCALAACGPATAAKPAAPASAPAAPAAAPATPASSAATAPAAPAAASAPAPAAWQAEWDRVVAAARQEGRVVVFGPPGDLYRTALTAFEKAYPGIQLEYTGASGRDFAPKVLAERDAGQYLVDVHVGGAGTPNFQLKPRGVFDPLKSALILPEVLDDSKWVGGFDAGYMDKEGQYVYAFQGAIIPTVWVNRDVIPAGELTSVQQLTDPQWRGKISWDDPRRTGYGGSDAGHFLMVLGEDWLRRAYQQDPVISGDLRQQVEWIVRGTYPIAIGMDATHLATYQRQGLGQNVRPLDRRGEEGGRLSPAWGDAMLVNRAPHPNAARVYLNWLLSKDGQTAWAATTGENSRRTDVEGPAQSAPEPGKTYRVVNSEEFNHYQDQALTLARELLR